MSCRLSFSCLLVLALVVSVGCPGTPSRVRPPTINASAAGRQALEMFDADKDGKISGDELDKCPGLKAAAAKVDPSGQNAITAEAITARIEGWQKSKLGRMSLTCAVTKGGRPVADVEVKLIPEKFLGENMKEATGKTGKSGVAMPTMPVDGPNERPGVAPGMYRIVVTGPNVPSKYTSADTTPLGTEVALDAKSGQEGVKIDLK